MPSLVLNVNGATRTVDVRDAAQPLLFVLRNELGLTGAKYGCGLGQCGACTVLIDGAATRSCLVPANSALLKSIVTIEGLDSSAKPRALQDAFVAEQAAQCGYCIAGIVMSATALLATNPKPTRDQAKQALAGNLCRCGTHQRIVNAVLRAGGTKA